MPLYNQEALVTLSKYNLHTSRCVLAFLFWRPYDDMDSYALEKKASHEARYCTTTLYQGRYTIQQMREF